MQSLQDVKTQFAGLIHPLTGQHQSLWAGAAPRLSRDEKNRRKVIGALKEHGALAKYRIVRLINLTPDGVAKQLDRLMADRQVKKKIGKGIDGRGNRTIYSLVKGTQ